MSWARWRNRLRTRTRAGSTVRGPGARSLLSPIDFFDRHANLKWNKNKPYCVHCKGSKGGWRPIFLSFTRRCQLYPALPEYLVAPENLVTPAPVAAWLSSKNIFLFSLTDLGRCLCMKRVLTRIPRCLFGLKLACQRERWVHETSLGVADTTCGFCDYVHGRSKWE